MFATKPAKNGTSQLSINNDDVVCFVYQTYDYDKFKIMPANRNTDPLHIRRLVESFERHHLITPLIVNDKMEVIDGQNRLEAAKETKKPIYYMIIPGYGIKEVQIFNTLQKNWQKINYLDMWCTEGRKHYLDCKEFMQQFPQFGIQVTLKLLTGLQAGQKNSGFGKGNMKMKEFEEGRFIIPDLNKSYTLAHRIMEFKDLYSGFSRSAFVGAIMPLLGLKTYNHKRMLHKMKVSGIKIPDKIDNIEQFRYHLQKIYNWKAEAGDRVDFINIK
jgi:hypothetical protein